MSPREASSCVGSAIDPILKRTLRPWSATGARGAFRWNVGPRDAVEPDQARSASAPQVGLRREWIIMAFRIGIDVGGTFTDCALYDDDGGRLTIAKVLTTTQDPSIGVLTGLDALLRGDVASAADLSAAIHATTIATNTVIQRCGPTTALLTTKGFRDVLVIGRQKRWELYDNSIDKPQHVVPRNLIWEAPERVLYDGSIRDPLDEAAVRRAFEEMKAAGVRAVAICFLHSYANPGHEKRAAELAAEVASELVVSLSSEVSPTYREYERTSTTVLNAYVTPTVAAYVQKLEEGLRERDFSRRLFIMQSNGGIATTDVVQKFPIRILESGPAAGALTVSRFASVVGGGDLLSFDMGGTTAKLCLIEKGRPALTGQFEIDLVNMKKNSGLPVSIPAVDLVEIGSGGGSIARVELGMIRVGPQSAGSDPGPICYGRGGKRPTVTDADLVLGFLNPQNFLGGKMRLDAEAARRGIEEHVARRLGLSVEAAAWGIHEIVTTQMAQAARVVSVGKGKDPRNFAFVPFGGAGPVHGMRLAAMLNCRRVIFPQGAGVMSAIGLLMAEPAFDLVQTRVIRLDADSLPTINALYGELEARGRRQLAASGIDGDVQLRQSCDMRFAGQGYEIAVALPPGPYSGDDLEKLREAFFATYTATYGDRAFDRTAAIDGVHWRLTTVAATPGIRLEQTPPGRGAVPSGRRSIYVPERAGFVESPVYDRYNLGSGDVVEGPAVIEERESTVVLIPNSRATVDALGNIVVDIHA